MQNIPTKSTGDSLAATEWNQVPDELENLIQDTGQTLSGGDLNQVSKAVSIYAAGGAFYTDSGASDAYVLTTVGAKSSPTSYFDGMNIEFNSSNANTGSTATVNVAGLGVKSIKLQDGTNPVANQILGRVEASFDNANDRFALKSITTSIDTISKIQPIDASVSANSLTVTLNPTTLDFRSSTLGDGTINTRIISPAISLTISSGSTLGTVGTFQSRIAILAIDSNGTVELAAVNIAGGNNLDETTLVTTVAEGGAGAADVANVIYSTTARTNVPVRVVGYVESTQASAGAWVTAPSTIQGYGGQAFAAMSSVGYGQIWQNVTRNSGTTYYNTTGKPIMFNITFVVTSNTIGVANISINGGVIFIFARAGGATVGENTGAGNVMIPARASYVITHANITTVVSTELR